MNEANEHALFTAIKSDINKHLDAVLSEFSHPTVYIVKEIENRWKVYSNNTYIGTFSSSDTANMLITHNLLTNVETHADLHAANALFSSLRKKNVDIRNTDAERLAITLFREMNARNIGYRFAGTYRQYQVIQRARKMIHDYFCDSSGALNISWEDISSQGYFGPGASVGNKETAYIDKISAQPITATSRWLYRCYLDSTRQNPTCYQTELERLKRFGWRRVDSSKISTVEKSREIDRVIATEPGCNMFMQLGLGTIINQRLELMSGYRPTNQQKYNRELARLGSENGSYATIDLKSASDTISLRFCRMLLPSELFSLLMDLRVRTTVYQSDEIRLGMMSSMGNGFTFPLQTLIFTSLVMASYEELGIPLKYRDYKAMHRLGNFGVFGDDIVVVQKVFPFLCGVLESCGFIVNHTKSFSQGPFRESCGGDYLHGRNVRGVYIKSLSGRHNLNALCNKLIWWSSVHFPLTSTIKYLVELVGNKYIVPITDSITSGIQVPWVVARPLVGRKFSRVYYRSYMEERLTFSAERYGVYAQLKATLHGSVEDMRFSRRKRLVVYNSGIRNTTAWDYSPSNWCLKSMRLEPNGIDILFDSTVTRWETLWYYLYYVEGVFSSVPGVDVNQHA